MSDTAFDVVPDGSDGLESVVAGVVHFRVLVTLSREHWARVPASHRDHDVRCSNSFIGPGFGELVGDMRAGADVRGSSEPPDQVVAVSPAMASKNPRAICERAAFWVHRNRTTGLPS